MTDKEFVDDLLRSTPRRRTDIGADAPPEHSAESGAHDLDDMDPESDRADETTQGGD